MKTITQSSAKEAGQLLQLVCFNLADEEYGVDINFVQEVIRVQKITPVPQMPPSVLGVINIRGNIVTVFDLRKQFGLPERPFGEATKILVMRINKTTLGIIVDQILDNLKLEAAQIDPVPEVHLRIDKECITGLGQTGDRMIIIVNLAAIDRMLRKEIGAKRPL